MPLWPGGGIRSTRPNILYKDISTQTDLDRRRQTDINALGDELRQRLDRQDREQQEARENDKGVYAYIFRTMAEIQGDVRRLARGAGPQPQHVSNTQGLFAVSTVSHDVAHANSPDELSMEYESFNSSMGPISAKTCPVSRVLRHAQSGSHSLANSSPLTTRAAQTRDAALAPRIGSSSSPDAPPPATDHAFLETVSNAFTMDAPHSTDVHLRPTQELRASIRDDSVQVIDEYPPSSRDSSPTRDSSPGGRCYSPSPSSSDPESDIEADAIVDHALPRRARRLRTAAVGHHKPKTPLKRRAPTVDEGPVRRKKRWVNPKVNSTKLGIADGAASVNPGAKKIRTVDILDMNFCNGKTYYFIQCKEGKLGWQTPENLAMDDPGLLERFHRSFEGYNKGVRILDTRLDRAGAYRFQLYFERRGVNKRWRNQWFNETRISTEKIKEWQEGRK